MTALTTEQQEAIRRLRMNGVSVRDIMAQTGIAMSTTMRYLRMFGLTNRIGHQSKSKRNRDPIERWKRSMAFE